MTEPTIEQMAIAKQLLTRIEAVEHHVAKLRRMKAILDAQLPEKRAKFGELISYSRNPHNLTHAETLYRQCGSEGRSRILSSYTWLLRDLIESDPLTGAKPRKIDFAQLPLEARPYLLAAFLGDTTQGVIPRLEFEFSNLSAGVFTLVAPGGLINVRLYKQNLAAIQDWLGVTYEITATTSNRITFTRRTPLPAVLPWDDRYLASGGIFVGIDTAIRSPVYLRLDQMTAGTLINGASGSGKSIGLGIILNSILANLPLIDAVLIVDGKAGLEFSDFEAYSPKIKVLWDEKDVWAIVAMLTQTIRKRQEFQRAKGIKTLTRNYIVLLIDETSAYTAKHSDKKGHAAFIENLAHIARRGRSAGIRCIFTTQTPTDDQIPTVIRANCDTVIAFRTPIDVHATALLGKLEELPADPRTLSKGHALVRNDRGEVRHVQFPMLPHAGTHP